MYGIVWRINMKRRDGFTLLELLVVIGLITLLMALLLPAIVKVKDSGQKKRAEVNARAIASAVDGYKLRYHKFPAKNADLEAGRDVTYGAGGDNNKIVFDKLENPPDGSPGVDDAFIDLSDFPKDASGNLVAKVGGVQFRITLDINADYTPSGGVKVEFDW